MVIFVFLWFDTYLSISIVSDSLL